MSTHQYLPTIEFKRIGDHTLPLPSRAHPYDAGLDLRAITTQTIYPGEMVKFGTGFAINLPPYMVGQILPRSGLLNAGIVVFTGIIDSGYTGELIVCLWNFSDRPYNIPQAARIAQLVISPIYTPQAVEVDSLPPSQRGNNGFGSTGQ